MKKLLFLLILTFYSTTSVAQWNNPIEGFLNCDYHVIGTLGVGSGELQINKEIDFSAYASIGVTPSQGLWRMDLRYTRFDDGGVRVNQYGIGFKVDFTLHCDVQCLYWMLGWNYGDFKVDSVRRRGVDLKVNQDGHDYYWNAGVGYRFRWTRNLDTSIEYNYNDVGRVSEFDLGHLRTLTLNLSYRF